MSRRVVVLSVVVLATLVIVADPAMAGPIRVPVDQSRTIPASTQTCPFDITSHVSGTFLIFNYADGSSKVAVADFFVTWSNASSGAALTTALAGPFFTSAPNPDGTVTVTIDGNNGVFIVPGQGPIYGALGRLVYIADASDPNTPVVYLQASGIQDPTPFPAVCSALA